MYVHFKCGKCGKHHEVDEKGAGMSFPCSDCGEPVLAPMVPSPHKCSYCHAEVLVADYLQGSDIQCPNCRKMFFVRPSQPHNDTYLQSPPPPKPPDWPSVPSERLDLLTRGGQWINRHVESIRGRDWSNTDNQRPAIALLCALGIVLLISAGSHYLRSLSKNEPAGSFSESPRDEWQVRHDLLYAQAMKSFVAPATNSMLEIITKNSARQSGTVVFISHDKVILDIGGSKRTYNRDWLSPQSREAILAPDYAEAFVRNTFKAEQDIIENDKAIRIREEKKRNEEARLKREEAERLRAEQEQAERWKAKSAALKAEKAEARRYNEELQRRADESAARRYAQAESQRQAQRQAQIAAQNEPYLGDMSDREEAAIAYATRIGGLVGGAAGLEYQLNQMIEDAKRYQDITEYSTDACCQ